MLYYYTTHRTILLSVNDQKKKDRPPVELNLTHHTLSLFYPTLSDPPEGKEIPVHPSYRWLGRRPDSRLPAF